MAQTIGTKGTKERDLGGGGGRGPMGAAASVNQQPGLKSKPDPWRPCPWSGRSWALPTARQPMVLATSCVREHLDNSGAGLWGQIPRARIPCPALAGSVALGKLVDLLSLHVRSCPTRERRGRQQHPPGRVVGVEGISAPKGPAHGPARSSWSVSRRHCAAAVRRWGAGFRRPSAGEKAGVCCLSLDRRMSPT